MLKIDGFDEALIGPAYIWGTNGCHVQVLVYDAEEIRKILVQRDGMDEEDAREYIEFNIEGAYMGPHTPILVWRHDMFWEDHDD
jgi:hypothetical protein